MGATCRTEFTKSSPRYCYNVNVFKKKGGQRVGRLPAGPPVLGCEGNNPGGAYLFLHNWVSANQWSILNFSLQIQIVGFRRERQRPSGEGSELNGNQGTRSWPGQAGKVSCLTLLVILWVIISFFVCVCVCVLCFLTRQGGLINPAYGMDVFSGDLPSEQDCIQCILHLNSKIAKWSANLQGGREAEREFKGRGWWWGPGRPLLDCGCDTNLIFAPSCLTETRSCFKMCIKLKQKPAENWIVNTLVGNKSDKTKNIVVTAEIMK